MRPTRTLMICGAALLAAAGLSIGQEQGPTREPSTTVAKPKNADTGNSGGEKDLPPIPSRLKKDKVDVANLPSFKTNVDIVTVDVAVMDNKGHFIPGIPPANFRVLEDNVPQQVRAVNMGEAPMTVAMVIEFSNRFQQYWGPAWYQTLQLAWGFASTLKPEDYVAVVAYDLRTEILTDFTADRSKVQEALSRLQIPGFSECNLFDAVTDTADRMSAIEGRKAIVLIASGIDTFSHMTFDQCRKSLQQSGVPIYAIGLMQTLRELIDARGGMGSMQRMDFLQADNEMQTFAKETGGQAFFPRFQGEYPAIFSQIQQA